VSDRNQTGPLWVVPILAQLRSTLAYLLPFCVIKCGDTSNTGSTPGHRAMTDFQVDEYFIKINETSLSKANINVILQNSAVNGDRKYFTR
jgi:hypothetical protein